MQAGQPGQSFGNCLVKCWERTYMLPMDWKTASDFLFWNL
jgi:hypothetical protein